MKGEISTLNFRLSRVNQTSTGHRYLFKDRRTGMSVYFNDVKVYEGGVVDQIKFRRDEGRAAYFDQTDPVPECILDALKEIEETGNFPTGDTVVSMRSVEDMGADA